ncbi:MAG: hypothetical protein IBX55_23070 [Methyloprofundus sp.]|nr:hypothetical protein [Methyloprofundus sp.]
MTAYDQNYGITAFIDLLGFGLRVKDINSQASFDEVAAKVQMVHEAFDLDPKTECEKEIKADMRQTSISLSDSIVINTPIESPSVDRMGSFDALMDVLDDFALAQAMCVFQGVFLRGAIADGWLYCEQGILISDGLVKAHAIESSISIPVIAVSDEIYEAFATHKDNQNYSVSPGHQLFRKFEVAESSFYFLDYLACRLSAMTHHGTEFSFESCQKFSDEEKDKYLNDLRVKNQINVLMEHKALIEKAYYQANTEAVKQKYRWLASYHNQVVNDFGFDNDYALILKGKP